MFQLVRTFILTAAVLCAFRSNVAADESSVRALEVEVRGTRSAPSHARREPSLASTVLSKEDLQQVGASTAQVLSTVPGVQTSRSGAQSDLATASIRGSDAAQVPVYLAGIRLNDEVSGVADLSTLPLWMIERVEVFRGSSPTGADRMGPGGAILLWPRQPRQPRVGAELAAGSFGERKLSTSLEAGSSGHGILLALQDASANNDYRFLDDQGLRFDRDERWQRRDNADFHQRDAWLVHQYRSATGIQLRSVANLFWREQGIVGLSVVPSRYARSESSRQLFGSSARIPCDARDGCQLSLSSSWVSASSSISDPRFELPSVRAARLESRGQRASHQAQVLLTSETGMTFGASLGFSADNLKVDRDRGIAQGGHRESTLLALSGSVPVVERWTLNANLLLLCQRTEGVVLRLQRRVAVDSGACGLREPMGRIGSIFRATDELSIVSNVARYLRLPTLSELYGTAPLVDGNPQLVPESGWSWDAGMRWDPRPNAAAHLAVEAFVFARTVQDLIRFRRSGIQSLAPFNIASAKLMGAEWTLRAAAFGHVRLSATGMWLQPKNTTAQAPQREYLPNTANLSVATRLELFAVDPLPRVGRAELSLSHLHRSRRFDDPAAQHELPAQNFLDLQLSGRSPSGDVQLSLALRNLSNSTASDLLGLPLPGRTVHAQAQAWF